MDEDFEASYSGRRLYGDDFDLDQIRAWYADEAEGYAVLLEDAPGAYEYGYHALNRLHGYSRLPEGRRFEHALCLGGAYGHELRPVLGQVSRITILDPSDLFGRSDLDGVPVTYRKPELSGSMPLETGSVDLLTCLGTLHHIPNVSFVIREIGRVLADDGQALIREPVVNMGDWRRPRRGLTKRERGIPLAIMRRALAEAGLDIVSERPCMVPTTARLGRALGVRPYNSGWLTALDAACGAMLAWNARYDRPTLVSRLAPASMFWVCRKREPAP